MPTVPIHLPALLAVLASSLVGCGRLPTASPAPSMPQPTQTRSIQEHVGDNYPDNKKDLSNQDSVPGTVNSVTTNGHSMVIDQVYDGRKAKEDSSSPSGVTMNASVTATYIENLYINQLALNNGNAGGEESEGGQIALALYSGNTNQTIYVSAGTINHLYVNQLSAANGNANAGVTIVAEDTPKKSGP